MEPISFATAVVTSVAYFLGLEFTHLRDVDRKQFKQEQQLKRSHPIYDFIIGFSEIDVTRENGRRLSTYDAYIKPILHSRKKLKVVKYAEVTEILFSGKTAIGVSYTRHGVQIKAHASKEIIISTGIFGTPMLFFKSGIGPKQMLTKANIPTVANLPVGKNFLCHPVCALGPYTVKDPSFLSSVNNNLTEAVFNTYLASEDEIILSGMGLGPQAFLVSSFAKQDNQEKWPDIQLTFYKSNYFDFVISNLMPNEFLLTVTAARLRAKNEDIGSITLDTAEYRRGVRDVTQLAKIDNKLLRNKEDYNVMLEGVDLGLTLLKTKAFKSIGTELQSISKCSSKYKFKTKDYLRCIVNSFTFGSHFVGTCRMGYGKDDKNSVVDSKLRVNGLNRLRVVDASIMPEIVNSNTYAPVVVIAEKAADVIRRDYYE